MKHLLAVIVAVVGLVAVVTGCGGSPRYDARLVAADSLMHDVPDSALALVQAVDTASVPHEGDRAYRDLLLTQARYRCYITATSDSAINRALTYYRHHDGEREKLTRAYIYKGAVMEELGHPDSAMLYYKHAEATAAPDDYFNLGYCKLRIAELYQDQISQDSSAIKRLKDAIYYFSSISDTLHIISALGKLGSICGTINPDSSIIYLTQAIQLSLLYNPSLQYSHKSTLAGIYYYQKDYKNAIKLSMDVLNNGQDYSNETQFYYYAILSYLKLGHLDSAKQVMKLVPDPIDKVDSMNYYNALAEIANVEDNHIMYKENNELAHEITESLLSESKKGKITVAEKEYDKIQDKTEFESKKNNGIKLFISIFLILLLIIIFISYYANCKLRNRINENSMIKHELENALADLKEQANRNKTVSTLVAHRITALNYLYQDIRVRINDESKVKKVVPLSSVIKSMNERNEILNIKLDEKFWIDMKLSVDGEYNGIYSFVESNYPNLSEKDLELFCLLCANLSPQIIKLCMNLSSAKTVTNYRSIIIKKKMGLDMSFDNFVQKYLDGDFSK